MRVRISRKRNDDEDAEVRGGLDLVAAAGVCLLLPPPLWLTLLSAPPPAQEEFVSVVEFVDVQGVFHDLGTKKVA